MAGTISGYADIEGWFRWLDKMLFEAILRSQSEGPAGDLVELGAYMGRSSVVIAPFLRPGERFVVIDLFGATEPLVESDANRTENARSYASLTRRKFEENYLALHPELPVIVQDLSSSVTDHVAPGGARFVHVDASHLYPAVREDALNARTTLHPEGVVVFDDYRSEHTPGVAAAVWESVLEDGLVPFVITPNKLYGTFGDPTGPLRAVRDLLSSDPRFWFEEQEIRGHRVVRAKLAGGRPAPPRALTDADVERLSQAVAAEVVQRLGGSAG